MNPRLFNFDLAAAMAVNGVPLPPGRRSAHSEGDR